MTLSGFSIYICFLVELPDKHSSYKNTSDDSDNLMEGYGTFPKRSDSVGGKGISSKRYSLVVF